MTRSSWWILVAVTLVLTASSPEAEAQSDDPLTFVGAQHDNEMNWPRGAAISADGSSVYVAASLSDAIAVFARDGATHQVTYAGTADYDADPFWLESVEAVAVSPDGVQVFVSGFGDDSLAAFTRTSLVVFVDGFESGTTGAWSNAVP